MDGEPGIVQAAGGLGQVLFADLHHQGIDFHHVDVFRFRVADQLPDHSAVSGADHQHLPDAGVDSHGHMGDHLVINEFILFRQHHITVQSQKTAELRGIEHIDSLILTFSAVDLPVHADGKFHMGGLRF